VRVKRDRRTPYRGTNSHAGERDVVFMPSRPIAAPPPPGLEICTASLQRRVNAKFHASRAGSETATRTNCAGEDMTMLLNRPIGDIAREQPSSTRVFLRHKIDFCCGGRRPLAEACKKLGLDAEQIARELEELGAKPEAKPQSPAELCQFIVTQYHDALRRDVPPLIDAARKVERVHAEKPAVPRGLADELDAFWEEMQQHMMKEERVLFPLLSRGAREQAAMPINVMLGEHDEHAVHLQRIRALTGDLQIPPHACATWSALYRGLALMESELMEHIHLENNVLFR
jgi:regulator of cell morphogenesis and NO signaling